jgi:hypothetical protein
MAIVVDQMGLRAAASRLSASTHTHSAAVAEPPGLDATSVSAVAQINAASAVLTALLMHSSALREVGALAVTGTAAMLTGQDDANAVGIANLSTPQTISGPTPLPNVPEPVLPDIPTMPAALAPLPGEAHAQALYSGPGAPSLHALAEHFDATATHLRGLSEDLSRTSQLIDTSWDDGHQHAGTNVARHARWLTHASEHTATLAARCRIVAQGFEAAKNNTPSPQEFAQARTNLAAALARFNASGGLNVAEVQAANQHLATLNSHATTQALIYHAHTTATALNGDTLSPAPSITRNGTVQAVDYDTFKDAPPPDPSYPVNDVIGEATDLDGNHVILRRGYYNGATDKGFGWDKIYWKHGLINPHVFEDLISHSRPVKNQGGTLVYEVPINRAHCTSGFLGLPSCTDTGESLTMRIVANTNPSADVPGGGPKGVITMFPEAGGSGVVEVKPDWTLTPPWVNNYAPIN